MVERFGKHQSQKPPYSPTLVDIEIHRLGGMTTAFDMHPDHLQSLKTPTTEHDRLVELSRENGRLRQEAVYFRGLSREVTPLLAVLRYHIDGLSTTVRECNEKIEKANAQWEAEESSRVE